MSLPSDGQRAGWTAEPERSNRWALRCMRWVAVTAGRPLTRWLLHPITLWFLLFDSPARRASRSYLARVLPKAPGWADAYRHLHAFASTVLDRVYLLQEGFEGFEVSATGPEAIREPLSRGEGVLLVGAHFGSFEALRASSHGRGARVAMLMFEENARLINATLAAIAPQVQLHTIALGKPGAMFALRRWLDDGGLAGMLADRTLPGQADRARMLRLEFLGEPVSFSDGPFRLASLLRRKVVFMAGIYRGGNRYDLRFVELADFSRPAAAVDTAETGADRRIDRALRGYVNLLESLCREAPYNWFNFFDFWAADADHEPAAR